MNRDTLVTVLKEEDFHLDALGRIVIENAEELKAVSGAAGSAGQYESLWNGACSNSRCG